MHGSNILPLIANAHDKTKVGRSQHLSMAFGAQVVFEEIRTLMEQEGLSESAIRVRLLLLVIIPCHLTLPSFYLHLTLHLPRSPPPSCFFSLSLLVLLCHSTPDSRRDLTEDI
jgi:hypothetical protein